MRDRLTRLVFEDEFLFGGATIGGGGATTGGGGATIDGALASFHDTS